MKDSKNLTISKCECGKAVLPPRNICPKCGNKMKKIEISNSGIIYSSTTLYSVQEGFSFPLNLVIVEFENKVKVLCEYKGNKTLEIGEMGKITKKNEKYEFTI